MNELALFAGAGGGILGGKLLGWRTICAVEWEPYAASVLCARQNDGLLPTFPIWDDVQTFDGKPWRGITDVISGGFPCQDISAAGKGKGLDGERSGMWHHMARLVGEIRPPYVFVENSPMLTTRGGTRVIADLTALGYDCRWTVMGASDVGANHGRDRMWIAARRRDIFSHAELHRIRRWKQQQKSIKKTTSEMANTRCELWEKGNAANMDANSQIWSNSAIHNQSSGSGFGTKQWWEIEPNVGRMVNGVAAGVDRLKAIGNGQVPLCAATAWEWLNQ